MHDDDFTPGSNGKAATTDLLRRRASLPYTFQFALEESSVCIKTDSTIVRDALDSLRMEFDLPGMSASAEWEIAVETQKDTGTPPRSDYDVESIEVYHFGPSCAVRMGNGSWFAHTPPSLNGVGFAMLAGNDSHRTYQLAAYLRTIVYFLGNAETRSISTVALEGTA